MNKQSLFLILSVSTAAIGLNGCSNNAQTGAVIGSLVGAGIGKSTSNHRDKRAVVGAVLGGIVGGAIGDAEDRRIAASKGNTTTTSPYYNGSTTSNHTHDGSTHSHGASNTQEATKSSNTHTHGNRSHTHPGAAGSHSHNNGPVSNGTVQQVQTTNPEVIYVERPYYPPHYRYVEPVYPISPVIIIGRYYYDSPRHDRRRNRVRYTRRR